MQTYFASAERTSATDLLEQIEQVSTSPFTNTLLNSMGGVVAILNDNRQIVSVNDIFLREFGVKDPTECLGLRLGEQLGCIHCHEQEGGCGTSAYCSTCGAAIAIAAALDKNEACERICALSTKKNDRPQDLIFAVRAYPVMISGNKYILIFLRDISLQHNRAALERTFFHDFNNMLTGLLGSSELLLHQSPNSELAKILHDTAIRLQKEVEIQRLLLRNEFGEVIPQYGFCTLDSIVLELYSFYLNHPVSEGKRLNLPANPPQAKIQTDKSILMRVLCNMVTNALEATDAKGEVQMELLATNEQVVFKVHNKKAIPEAIKKRIFQRNFSTKPEDGRGLGTYSMKLFGEQVLGGKVWFRSEADSGTFFVLELPLKRDL